MEENRVKFQNFLQIIHVSEFFPLYSDNTEFDTMGFWGVDESVQFLEGISLKQKKKQNVNLKKLHVLQCSQFFLSQYKKIVIS